MRIYTSNMSVSFHHLTFCGADDDDNRNDRDDEENDDDGDDDDDMRWR